jgi:hypothetical protein
VLWLWLGYSRARANWHLQHDRVLAFAPYCQFDDLTIRQFERIMVHTGLIQIHLPKPGNFMLKPFEAEAVGAFALNMCFKSKLRAG